MPVFHCYGEETILHTEDIDAADRVDAFHQYRKKHPKIMPEGIGVDTVVGACEVCEAPIFAGEVYYTDTLDVQVCAACVKEVPLIEEEEDEES